MNPGLWTEWQPILNLSVTFVCLGLTSLLNIWGHITTVSACSSGTLINVLPHRNVMPQTQDMAPHTVTVYRHGADLSLWYPLMWNVTLEYTATHHNVFGKTRLGNTRPSTQSNAQLYAVMVVASWKLGRKYRTNRLFNPGPAVCESITLSARPQPLPLSVTYCSMLFSWTSSVQHGSHPMISLEITNGIWWNVTVMIWCIHTHDGARVSIY